MRGANFRKETARAFKIMVVTFAAGFLQPVGNLLILDNSKRGVRTRLAAVFQILKMPAELVQDRPLLQAPPGGDQPQSCDTIGLRFVGRSPKRFLLDQAVAR